MKGWILSIVGIIFLGVIIEIVLPNGKTNSFIKHIFNVFVLFVIISPIASFLKSNVFNVSDNIKIDSKFIYETNMEKIDQLEKEIKSRYDKMGLSNVSIVINSNIFEEQLTINNVYVDVSNEKDIDKKYTKDDVIKVVVDITNINERDVIIYGYQN